MGSACPVRVSDASVVDALGRLLSLDRPTGRGAPHCFASRGGMCRVPEPKSTYLDHRACGQVITPAKPHTQEHVLDAMAHGRTMAKHGRQPLSRGSKLDAEPHKGKHYKHSAKGQGKGAKKGKRQNSPTPPPQPSRRVIPIYGV